MTTLNETFEIQFPLHAAPAPQRASGNGQLCQHGKLPRLTQVMALAIYFQDILQRGEAHDYADLARLGCISRERISQILELRWLDPAIQQEILEFQPTGIPRFPISEVAVREIASTLRWEDQRKEWEKLKAQKQIGRSAVLVTR